MFEKLGGPEVGAMARPRMFEGHRNKASLDAWLRIAFPLYTRRPRDPNVVRRAVGNPWAEAGGHPPREIAIRIVAWAVGSKALQ